MNEKEKHILPTTFRMKFPETKTEIGKQIQTLRIMSEHTKFLLKEQSHINRKKSLCKQVRSLELLILKLRLFKID